jgi:MFS family permease
MRLWAAQTGSAFGSRITRTALPMIAILTLKASPNELALLAALGLAPAFFVGLFAGHWADRTARRPLMIGADVARALLILSIPVAAWLGGLSVPQLCVVAALVGAATSVFEVADRSFLPSVVGDDGLVEANARLQATESIAEASGPGVAGLLIQALGAPLAVAVDALTYVWSALMLGAVRTREARPKAPPAEADDSARPSTWLSGFRAVFADPILRPLMTVEAVIYLAFGFFATFYVLVALRYLHLSPGVTGLVISLGGVAAFGGSLLAQPMARRLGTGRTLVVSLALAMGGALLIPLSLMAGRWGVFCLVGQQLVGDTFLSIYMIHAVSLRQASAPPAALGRVNAAFQVCVGLMLPISALAAGPLTEVIGIGPTTWIAGAVALAGVPVLAFSRVARLA